MMASKKKDYTLEEIDDIVATYQSGGPKKPAALSLLIDIFHPYLLKYVKITKGGRENTWDNKDARGFLSLFVSRSGDSKKSFVEVKSNIAATLSSYEHGDLYNEYVAIFITILNKYKKREGVNATRYLTLYLRFAIRNFIVRISRDPLFKINHPVFEEEYVDHDIFLDKMAFETPYLEEQSSQIKATLDDSRIHPDCVSLSWVISCPKYIFSHLSHYQRYLLYLYFIKSEGCVNIANRLNKSKDTISSHIEKIFKKINRLKDD